MTITTECEARCVYCGKPIDRKARGGNAKTCSRPCGDEWRRVSQKKRRQRYAGKCHDCGAATDGSGGYHKHAKRCKKCRRAHQSAQAVWSDEAILEAIRSWHNKYGRPPGARDWRRSSTSTDHHPVTTLVQRKFGTWSEAIRRAGYEPTPPGKRIIRKANTGRTV